MLAIANRWATDKRASAVIWARHAWEKDWRPMPMPVQEQEAVEARKKAKGKGGVAVVTIAPFLADSDDAFEEEATVVEVSSDELDSYLLLPDVPPDIPLLEWWKGHAKDFPILARMARQFLAVPASSAGVERAFSKVGFMHSDLRKSLNEGTIQHSLMAALNIV
ncbi:hypothetical protein CYMTET_44206 [Cymbomonas tetramitiformis]|uniref:HAT C-terminal dimerisation domain-containing protein n=1 Tax=Cymbomonas tetramitiformis TaxID=36881 RepID=A0AAE0EZJ7_9CHLO|nr:hypothetical protein CYMTET_44206 [Cymbomonas tetramitiformis]